MKYFLIVIYILLSLSELSAQNLSPAQIRQKMAEIRRTTNWDDEAEAKKANDKIKELAKQLMMSGKNKDTATKTDSIKYEQQKEGVEYKTKLWDQMWESAKQGEKADIDLAKPLREEIVQAYKDDEDPTVKNTDFLNEMTMLVIDMSQPHVQKIIDQMDKYKSIKTLIITGGKIGVPVNLNDILNRASGYPLENLYIIDFKIYVTSIPSQIEKFKKLKLLSVINNQIKSLPSSAGTLTSLQTLYVDINPIKSILPEIQNLKNLETIGMGKTNISKTEKERIKKLLPNCKILEQ